MSQRSGKSVGKEGRGQQFRCSEVYCWMFLVLLYHTHQVCLFFIVTYGWLSSRIVWAWDTAAHPSASGVAVLHMSISVICVCFIGLLQVSANSSLWIGHLIL